MVFPEAVGPIVKGWRNPDDWVGKNVGVVDNAKERLAKAVRPRGTRKSKPREYHERDSIQIAENIAANGSLASFANGVRTTTVGGSKRQTRCASLERFRLKVLSLPKS